MSEFLQDVKKEKTRIFYIKRAQRVLKKLNEPLDNYKYFVSHFDDVINFLKEKKNKFRITCLLHCNIKNNSIFGYIR